MVVLGADLSYTRTGLVWLDSASNKVIDHTAFKISAGANRLLRASELFFGAVDGRKANLVIIEDAAYGAPSRITVGKLKELGAIFKLVLEQRGIDYLEVSPTLVKKWLTGKGTAEKHIVARELKRKYGISFSEDPGNDLSDAAALAAWGMER